MSLAQELEALTRSYLVGRTSLEDVRQWLVAHAQDVVDAEDQRLDELDGELWILISEFDRGDRDEVSVRADLDLFFQERGDLAPALSPSEAQTPDA